MVHKKGNCLIVPVNVAGKARPFLVDTGCPDSVFDESLFGPAHFSVVGLDTPGGRGRFKRYRAPIADLDGIPLGLSIVLGSNLK